MNSEKRREVDIKFDTQSNSSDFFHVDKKPTENQKGFKYSKKPSTQKESEFSESMFPGFKKSSNCLIKIYKRRRYLFIGKHNF